MILESPAALRLLASLAELGAEGGGRHYLTRKAGVGTTTFYRLIGTLIEHGLVLSRDGHYALSFANPYCLRFKLWNDMERLYQIPPADRDIVLNVLSQTRARAGDSLRALWLVGSGARGELKSESDLDFLLVTTDRGLRPDQNSGRQISMIEMSESEFREAYHRADSFIVSALREGIVLLDREFVQEFYVSPPAIKLGPQAARSGESIAAQNRDRLLLDLSDDNTTQAHATLESQAIHIARLMLRIFGELPSNRERLVDVSEVYFGADWAKVLRAALISPPDTKQQIIALSRRLFEQHSRFQSHLAHLQRFASIPTSSAGEMERLVAEVFRELLPNSAPSDARDLGVDAVLRGADGSLFLIECKSFKGPPAASSVDGATRQLEQTRQKLDGPSRAIFVLNSHVELPPSERPPLSRQMTNPEIDGQSDGHSPHGSPTTKLVTGLDLLRAHNRLHLEEQTPQTLFEELLDDDAARSSN